MSDIAPLATLKQQITENLEGSIASLLPKEVWKQMAENGIDALLKPKSYRHPITNEDVSCSRLEYLVWEEQLKQIREIIKEEMDKPEWRARWDEPLRQQVSPAVKEAVAANVETFVKAFITGSMTSVVQQVIVQMQNGMFR